MMPLTKNPKLKTEKEFFIANYKICWVFWAFEQLSSAFGTGVMPAQSHVPTGCFHANHLN